VVFNMVFIHFPDCSLCFTHVLGTLMQFTLLLCYIGSYLFPGGRWYPGSSLLAQFFTVGKPRLVVVTVQGAPYELYYVCT